MLSRDPLLSLRRAEYDAIEGDNKAVSAETGDSRKALPGRLFYLRNRTSTTPPRADTGHYQQKWQEAEILKNDLEHSFVPAPTGTGQEANHRARRPSRSSPAQGREAT